jgi:hypothetical protein
MRQEVEIRIPSLALDILKRIVRMGPQPQVSTDTARKAAQSIGNHLICLILTASDANVEGRHSAAVSLFRNMEDALDCFGAVALSPGAAERWAKGELKASEAAKLYEDKLGTVKLPNGDTATDYRKNLRRHFNYYAHCTPYLTDWDLYPYFDPSETRKLLNNESEGHVPAELRVNTGSRLLLLNAIRIGAFLVAHTLEFSRLVALGYEDFLGSNEEVTRELQESNDRLERLLKTNWGAVYLETPPPEVKNPRIQHPENRDLAMELNFPDQPAGDAQQGGTAGRERQG